MLWNDYISLDQFIGTLKCPLKWTLNWVFFHRVEDFEAMQFLSWYTMNPDTWVASGKAHPSSFRRVVDYFGMESQFSVDSGLSDFQFFLNKNRMWPWIKILNFKSEQTFGQFSPMSMILNTIYVGDDYRNQTRKWLKSIPWYSHGVHPGVTIYKRLSQSF